LNLKHRERFAAARFAREDRHDIGRAPFDDIRRAKEQLLPSGRREFGHAGKAALAASIARSQSRFVPAGFSPRPSRQRVEVVERLTALASTTLRQCMAIGGRRRLGLGDRLRHGFPLAALLSLNIANEAA